ncbi:MAG: amidohydrolase family protein [Pirellulaceae bacterium]
MPEPAPPIVTYRFGWILPIDQPPIRGGVIQTCGGWIAAVGASDNISIDHDLSHLTAAPALVNAHTHLEFSLLENPLGTPGMPFTAWIGEVIRYRQSQGDDLAEMKQRAITQGLKESAESGVGLVGEISTLPLPENIYAGHSCEVVSLLELIGMSDPQIAELQQIAAAHLQGSTGEAQGLSPHAPYSVHRQVVKRAAKLSAHQRFPVAMHLAETQAELELLARQSGSFREMLQGLGVWNESAFTPVATILDYLRALTPAHRALAIHGNYLSGEEIQFLAEQRDRMTLVYCPRTHHYFGHDPYPLPELLLAGVRVALGTDSRASNPSLNLWEEVQHLAQHFPAIPPEAVLRMVTSDAAHGLAQEENFGTLAPGKRAVLSVWDVAVDNERDLWPEMLTGQPRLLSLT